MPERFKFSVPKGERRHDTVDEFFLSWWLKGTLVIQLGIDSTIQFRAGERAPWVGVCLAHTSHPSWMWSLAPHMTPWSLPGPEVSPVRCGTQKLCFPRNTWNEVVSVLMMTKILVNVLFTHFREFFFFLQSPKSQAENKKRETEFCFLASLFRLCSSVD